MLPSSLPFDDVDLCVLIGNALDNAFDAAITSNCQKPVVEISIHYKWNAYIFILQIPFLIHYVRIILISFVPLNILHLSMAMDCNL